jgi:hypothetical protein
VLKKKSKEVKRTTQKNFRLNTTVLFLRADDAMFVIKEGHLPSRKLGDSEKKTWWRQVFLKPVPVLGTHQGATHLSSCRTIKKQSCNFMLLVCVLPAQKIWT